jgi:hypothetical protein
MYNPEAPFGLELMAERKRRGHVLKSYVILKDPMACLFACCRVSILHNYHASGSLLPLSPITDSLLFFSIILVAAAVEAALVVRLVVLSLLLWLWALLS